MKVIFLQDLPHVAYAGETKEVADGYARNYLIPKKLAAIARPGIVNVVAARQTKVNAALALMAENLDGVAINLTARVGAKDRLYGAITTADIATELSAVSGLEIDKKKIELDKPIHELGSYEVTVRMGKDAVSRIQVNVTAAETKEPETDLIKEAKTESKAAIPEASAAPETTIAEEPKTGPEAAAPEASAESEAITAEAESPAPENPKED